MGDENRLNGYGRGPARRLRALTFGDQMFTWEELNAAPGDHQVGFIVDDLDGNRDQANETITVQ